LGGCSTKSQLGGRMTTTDTLWILPPPPVIQTLGLLKKTKFPVQNPTVILQQLNESISKIVDTYYHDIKFTVKLHQIKFCWDCPRLPLGLSFTAKFEERRMEVKMRHDMWKSRTRGQGGGVKKPEIVHNLQKWFTMMKRLATVQIPWFQRLC